MQIQVVTAGVQTQTNSRGKPMQVLEVIYKNLTFQGKVENKKLFDFGAQKDAFTVLAAATSGQVYEIEVKKNDAGYNDWIKISKSDTAATVSTGTSTSTPPRPSGGAGTAVTKGNWETPEERAKKQIYIVRQSSLTAAISTLTHGRKTELKPEEVIGLASEYEAFVFGAGDVAGVVKQDIGGIEGLVSDDLGDQDIPF